jgi:hypothetical protein
MLQGYVVAYRMGRIKKAVFCDMLQCLFTTIVFMTISI